MKTPEEIKKGLECCKPLWKSDHWKTCDQKCPYTAEWSFCKNILNSDALALIQQLESQNAELKREMAAAIMALATCAMDGLDGNICNYCTRKNCDEQDLHYECFEWRGIQHEPPKED